jgi:hypothetical protein
MTKATKLRELFAEKSLWDLLNVYEDASPKPMPERYYGVLAAIIALIAMIMVWQVRGLSFTTLDSSARSLASYSLTVSSALMGVVIAGMSIFAASLKANVASKLIATNYPETKVSSLKFIFSMFAYLLFALFLVISLCAVYFLIVGKDTIGGSVLILESGPTDFHKGVVLLYISIQVGITVFLLSLLRSFIWNLHIVLMVVIAAEQVD